jgi:DNA replication and repair protein RecF
VIVKAIEVSAFRNLTDAVIEPCPRLNVFSGDNAQGKTNLLEAVYLVGTTRSFRATRLQELVRFGSAAAKVGARVISHGLARRHEIALEAGRKSVRLDGKTVRDTADYFRGISVVLFSPEDLGILRGSPSGRRRLLDRAVFNRVPAYLAESQSYDKVLRSRNALLRDGGPDSLLDVYDEQLASHGARIMRRRAAYLAEFAPRVASAFESITHSGLAASIRYAPSEQLEDLVDDAEDRVWAEAEAAAEEHREATPRPVGDPGEHELARELGERIRRARPRDRARGYSTLGPHTDDLHVLLAEHDARLYASQGQLRALVLAIKIAEIRLLREVHGAYPILLLDDVSSELDSQRNQYLFDFLDEISCQCFLTTTHPDHVRASENREDFHVVKGVVTVEK